MIADVPLGAFLSGGVDSSIVVAEMAAASSRPVKTFSIGFDDPTYNELPKARRVALEFATDHHEQLVRPDAVALAPKMARHYGEPYADSSAIPTFYLAEFARRNVTVALNGDGGDESFAGYLRYVANDMTSRIPEAVGKPIAAAAALLPDRAGSRTLRARTRRLLAPLSMPPAERYTRHVSIFSTPERDRLMEPDLRKEVDMTRAEGVIRHPWEASTANTMIDRLMDVDVQTYLPEDLLVKVDIASMAYSLEARSPLLDVEVMEFAASIPASLKARMGRKKWLLRRAYRSRVPDSILDGPKKGFGVPLARWFREDLRESTREALLDPGNAIGQNFRREEVSGILAAHSTGRADHAFRIWALLQLELWHQEFKPAT
jgi:asparagine synthase (glutamine-hydrolysing)